MKKYPSIAPGARRSSPSSTRRPLSFTLVRAALTGALAVGLQGSLLAGTDEDTSKKTPVVEKKADSRIKFSAFAEVGITANPDGPDDHQNFGRLFDDRPNEPMLNQLTATVERALAPDPGKFDWGFKLQAGYGDDGRYLNTLGTLENVTRNIEMPYVVEAYGNLHFPFTKDASMDFKFGQFATILGAETIDPRSNVFYSHDYIFNFGLPFQHLGGLATIHINPTVDIYAGVTRGVNTSIYDNNGYAAFLGGIGLNNLCNGKLTILASTSLGPENPREYAGQQSYHGSGTVSRGDFRYYGDLVATYKINDKFTSVTEGVYTYDSGYDTDFYGGAETLSYAFNDMITAGLRLEAVRDSDGFYVAQFAAPDDFTNYERGVTPLDPRTVGGGPNTYLEVTAGVQIKPLKYLTVRPEIRFDHSTEGHPFDDSTKQYSITIGADAIIGF